MSDTSRALGPVLDFAARSGALMLANGSSAAEAAMYARTVLDHAGTEDATVTVSYGEVMISHHPAQGVPHLRVESVQNYGFDYGLQTTVSRTVAAYVDGSTPLEQARQQLQSAASASITYPRWVTLPMTGLAGAAAALIYGGNWIVAIVGFFAYLALLFLLESTGKHQWPNFFVQVLSGALAAGVAAGLHLVDPGIDASSVVIAIIIIMMAGMTSTGALQDAVAGYYMNGLGRIFEAILNTIGLIAGVRLGMVLADLAGITVPIDAQASMGQFPLPTMMLAAAFVSLGSGIVLQNPLRVVVPTTLLAMAVYAVFAWAAAGPYGQMWARAVAAAVAGFIIVIYTRILKAPASTFALGSFIVLLPGTLLYQGLWGSTLLSVESAQYFVSALVAALALASGLLVGEYLAVMLLGHLRVVRNKIFSPVFGVKAANHMMSGQRGATVSSQTGLLPVIDPPKKNVDAGKSHY